MSSLATLSQRAVTRPGRILALLVSACFLCLHAPLHAQEDEYITVVSWGGSYARSSVEAFHKRFTAETGINIRLEEYSGGLAQIRAQVETGNVIWDVVDMEAGDTILGCDEGLLVENDYRSLPPAPDGTPATEDFIAGYDTDCGVKSVIYGTVVAYDKQKFPARKPTSMADFFDLEKFPGRRGMRRAPNANLEFALVADGVPVDQVYQELSKPGGVDRALKKLGSIKDSIVWWETGAQPPQLLADGEVLMTTAFNGRIFNAVTAEQQSFHILWDGQVLAAGYHVIIQGTSKPELAARFVAFSTSTRSLANLTKYISYSPMRRSAQALVGVHELSGIDVRPHLPNDPRNTRNAVREDPLWWTDYQDEMNEIFFAWLAR